MKILILVVLVAIAALFGACIELPLDNLFDPSDEPTSEATTIKDGINVYHNKQPRYYGASSYIPVRLSNNELARNPTWQELINFLILDETDENAYVPGIRVCAEFAAGLHNNAEKAGIKAAWVSLEFTDNLDGHALNAFETTDKGLVFVDCTGGAPSYSASITNLLTGETTNGSASPDSHDKIAYIEIGREYGLISIENTSSPRYSFYLDYLKNRNSLEERLAAYNSAVEQYNSKIEAFNRAIEEYELLLGGRAVITDPAEYEKLSNINDQLESRRLELTQEQLVLERENAYLEGEFGRLGRYKWFPLGTVRSVDIYW